VPMLTVVQWASAVIYLALAVVAVHSWQRQRNSASGWLAASFTCVGLVAVSGVLPEPGPLTARAVIGLLLAFPGLLHRFAHAFARPGDHQRLIWAVDLLATGCVAIALLGPTLPGPLEPQPGWVVAYTMVALTYWALALGSTGWVFVRGARGLTGVARSRLRRLAGGSAALAAALVMQVAAAGDRGHPALLTGALVGLVGGVLFVQGFAPGPGLRRRWRVDAEREVDRVTFELMSATSATDVTVALLPAVSAVMGAESVTFTDPTGQQRRVGAVASPTAHCAVIEEDLHHGRLRIEASPWSPMFGEEERRLVRRMATIADLALDRVVLHERERKARQAAERAIKDREALLAAVAHDMKGPLTAVVGFGELLLGPMSGDLTERANTFVGRMVDNSRFVANLAGELVEVAQAQASGSGGRQERVPLYLVCRDATASLAFTNPQATIEVAALPVVWIDPTRARQVLGNVITNAVRHAGRDDVAVSVFARTNRDGSADVIVADNGVGIRAEDRERVFELFERLDATSPGSGLGMAICRRVMEGIGGSIAVLPAGEGARVRLRFPAEIVIAGVAPRPPATTLAPSNPGADGGVLAGHPDGLRGVPALGAHG